MTAERPPKANMVPKGHFWRGVIDPFYCRNCDRHHSLHLHTDEASLCPVDSPPKNETYLGDAIDELLEMFAACEKRGDTYDYAIPRYEADFRSLVAQWAANQWRCFHCTEVFTDADSALEHFGRHQGCEPACTIDIAEYRRMEEKHERSCEEDTELHRALMAKSCEMTRAVQRAEETGYARGLSDARAQWAAGQKEEIPPELFDGHAIWIECGNVPSQDVTRVLDSIVKLIRKRQS